MIDETDEQHAAAALRAPPLTLTVQVAAELAAVRSNVRNWLSPSLSAVDIDDVILASGEALANAVEHGEPPITISLEWAGDLLLQMRVRDSGAWRRSAESTSRGLGIPIMTTLMDSFRVETTDGTAIQLSRQFTT